MTISDEEIEKSLAAVNRAKAPENVLKAVLEFSNRSYQKVQQVPVSRLWLVAASLAALLFLNVYALRQQAPKSNSHAVQQLLEEYQLGSQNQISF